MGFRADNGDAGYRVNALDFILCRAEKSLITCVQ